MQQEKLSIIEHHLDLIKNADWIIDLGPGAGENGGRLVAEGTPESLSRMNDSHTGKYLLELLNKNKQVPPTSE